MMYNSHCKHVRAPHALLSNYCTTSIVIVALYCDYHYCYYLSTISHIGDEYNRNHTMVSFYGKLDEFDPGLGEDWIQYVGMEYYFLANEITSSSKKRALLINAMGANSYTLLRNLITAAAPSDKSFMELVEALKKHSCLPPLEIVQRFKFNTCITYPEMGDMQRLLY